MLLFQVPTRKEQIHVVETVRREIVLQEKQNRQKIATKISGKRKRQIRTRLNLKEFLNEPKIRIKPTYGFLHQSLRKRDIVIVNV